MVVNVQYRDTLLYAAASQYQEKSSVVSSTGNVNGVILEVEIDFGPGGKQTSPLCFLTMV